MRVLDPGELHEIHQFQRATASFIENNSTAVREQIKAQLSGAKLSQWEALSNVIVANSVFQPTAACIKKLRSALSAFEEVNKLAPIKQQRDGVQTLFESAFKMLISRRAFARWEWQVELVQHAYYYN